MNDISDIQKLFIGPFSSSNSINNLNKKYSNDGDCLLHGFNITPQGNKILITKGSCLKDLVLIEFIEDIILPFSETNYINNSLNVVVIKYIYEIKNKYNYAIIDIVSQSEYENNKDLYLYLTHIQIKNDVFKNFSIDFNELKVVNIEIIKDNIINFFENNIISDSIQIETDINQKIKFHVLNDEHIHNNLTLNNISFNKIINIPQIHINLNGDLNGSKIIDDFNNIVIDTSLDQTSHTHTYNEINSVSWNKIINRPQINITFSGDVEVSSSFYQDLQIYIGLTVKDDSHFHSDSTITSVNWENIINVPQRFLFYVNKPTFIKPINYSVEFWDIFEIQQISATNSSAVPNYTGVQDYVYWQLSTDNNFNNIIYEYEGNQNLTQIDLRNYFEINKTYYIRVKQGCNNYISSWSDVIKFTTKSSVNITKPTILQPINNAQNLSITNIFISLSNYQSDINTYIHVSTDYQIATDYNFNNIIYDIVNDTVNLQSINISVNLNLDTIYYIRARFNSINNSKSDWSNITKVTTIKTRDRIVFFQPNNDDYLLYPIDIKKDTYNYFVMDCRRADSIRREGSCYIKFDADYNILNHKFLFYKENSVYNYRVYSKFIIKSLISNYFYYPKQLVIIDSSGPIRNVSLIESMNNDFSGFNKIVIFNSNTYYHKIIINMKKFNLNNNYVILIKTAQTSTLYDENISNETSINFIFIVDSDFNIITSKGFKKNENTEKMNIKDFFIDNDDNIILYGYSIEYMPNTTDEYEEFYVLKLDKNLNIIKSRRGTNNYSFQCFYDGTITNDNNFYLLCGIYKNTECILLKIDKDLTGNVTGTYELTIKKTNPFYSIYFKKVVIYNNNIICLGVMKKTSVSDEYFLMSFDMDLNCLNKKFIKSTDESNVFLYFDNMNILDNKLICMFHTVDNSYNSDDIKFGFIVMGNGVTYFSGEQQDLKIEFYDDMPDNINNPDDPNKQLLFTKNHKPYTALHLNVSIYYNYNYNNYLVYNQIDSSLMQLYYTETFDHSLDNAFNFTRSEISL